MPFLPQRHSPRLHEYDYTQPGAYFITCVTSKRVHIFGEIVSGEMKLSPLGNLVHQEWQRLVKRFSSIELDEYVIMPNHMHGIIVVHSGETTKAGIKEGFGSPVSGSIPTIVRSFKSSVTQQSQFQLSHISGTIWQSRYYEHVIRDETDWERIRVYIQMNPQNWESDEENAHNRIPP